MKPVGILGGMGPEATILLMQKVLAAIDAGDDADHVPLIVHQNPQVPSRIKALIEGTGADPAPTLRQMARDLESAGAQALAMPCNTAHHYAAAISASTDLPFINMIDLTARALTGRGRIGMLASPAVRKVGVFDIAFSGLGLEAVYPDDGPILGIIQAVKAGDEPDIGAFQTIAAQLLSETDYLCVACTELSLLTDALPSDKWTDSLDCLTHGMVSFATG
ncbi:MAG: amino acid racemase [Pseudomonadota bacterium]